MNPDQYKVLFLCTGNSARSIMAEAILDRLGGERFGASSAGSHPTRKVNPGALRQLAERGHDVAGLASKSWDVFAAPDAPPIDIVITVCDAAAGESCPVWPGQPLTAHWGIPDPAAVTGSDEDINEAFASAYEELSRRIRQMLELPLASMSRAQAEAALRALARAD